MPEQDWNGFPDDTVLADTDVLLVARGAGGVNITGAAILKKDSSGNAQVGNPSSIKARFHIRGPASQTTTLANAVTNAALLIEPWQGSAWGLAIGSVGSQVQSIQGVDTSGSGSRDIAINPLGGNLIIGGTAQVATSRLSIIGSNNGAAIQCANSSVGVYISNLSGTAAYQPMSFCNAGSSFSQIGSITCSSTTTAYNTSSDYRLKENIVDLEDSGGIIDALRPRRGNWIDDGSDFCGFIAHEFAEVFPASVQGAKDETEIRPVIDEATGEPTGEEIEVPKMQSMQASSSEVMAVVIAELQSLRRRLAEAEAQIEALSQ